QGPDWRNKDRRLWRSKERGEPDQIPRYKGAGHRNESLRYRRKSHLEGGGDIPDLRFLLGRGAAVWSTTGDLGVAETVARSHCKSRPLRLTFRIAAPVSVAVAGAAAEPRPDRSRHVFESSPRGCQRNR